MEYLEGEGLSLGAKIAIIAACVVVAAAVCVALSYGQIYLAAQIMGMTFKAFVAAHGAAAVSTAIAAALGVSVVAATAVISAVLKL